MTDSLKKKTVSQTFSTIKLLNENSKLSINLLCKIASVSKSGYYSWLNRKLTQEESIIVNLIKQQYWRNQGKFGYRKITMNLRRKLKLVINHKKVQRIMQKYGLKAVIRKNNNHKSHVIAQRKNENWTIAPNILNGNFSSYQTGKVYSTDVTYLKLKNRKTYFLSAIKDLASGEISAYSLSDKHDINLILNTVNQIKNIGENCILHSDRGVLYSSFKYIQKLREKGITRSMSEAGKPTQNAPIESFFGHLKDEVDYKKCNNFSELKDKIDNYVYYYNTSRYQWNKKMLTPNEVKEYLLSYNSCPF